MATVAPVGLKNLRIALIQGAKITEDRTLKRRGPVSIGTDPKNTFVVPVSNLPATFTLFEYVNNQFSLVFSDQMDGKVKVGDSELTFDALKQQGMAVKRGNVYVVPLKDSMKGRVGVGEVSLLFQFVTPPPEPPKPELPPGIKGSLLSGIDQLFFSILAASILVHFSGAGFIACQPMPPERELSLDELNDRFAKVMMPTPVDKPKVVEEKPGKEEKKEEKTEKKEVAEAKPTSAGEKKAALEKKVASKGLLKILGSSGGNGAIDDVLGSSTGSGNIAEALTGAGGVQVGTADGMAGGPKGGAAGTAAGIGDLGTSGGGNVNLGDKKEVAVKGRVADVAPEVDSGDVDREALTKYVRARRAAIQGCYEKELKRNPSLKGKVVVRFEIGTNGRPQDVEIEENSLGNDAVASCIRTLIRGWVFPFKPEAPAPVAFPFVFSPAS
ncbi:MAG: AgmX/PglI C-terminal domain-containing protein [Myxococcaceae bacterium]|nr:AgmX/PglI C-terminal domain-containing protein [Myxococcaceae bacterium]